MDKIKLYVFAFFAGFLNPVPTRVAVAVALLGATANLLGALAAIRSGEGVRGSKMLKGATRLALYFVIFNAIYVVMQHMPLGGEFLSGIYTAVALYEFLLLAQKGHELGIIPAGLFKSLVEKINKYSKDVSGSDKGEA